MRNSIIPYPQQKVEYYLWEKRYLSHIEDLYFLFMRYIKTKTYSKNRKFDRERFFRLIFSRSSGIIY